MKKLFIIALLFSIPAYGLKSKENIDAAIANITTSFTQLIQVTHASDAAAVNNQTDSDIYVCFESASGSCVVAEEMVLGAGQGLVFDGFPAASGIFVASVSGTISSGVVSAAMWQD